MALEKVPFVNYVVGEKDKFKDGKVLTVRLSAKEYTELMILAKHLHISRDSTLLKKLAEIGKNVLVSTFGLDMLKWLLDDSRVIDDSKLDGLVVEKRENVIQNLP